MKIKKDYTNTFYCFSPFVMLMTFLIEVSLLIFTFVSRKNTRAKVLVMVLLACLATFQLAEYSICEGLWLSSQTWAAIGFISITVLPAVGLDLITTAAKRKIGIIHGIAYLAMAVWFGIFLNSGSMESFVCGGNYMIFDLDDSIATSYGIYYYGLLVLGVALAGYYWIQAKDSHRKNALLSLMFGYLGFMVPTALVAFTFQETARAAPSIMCGFAVIFALVITFVTLPQLEAAKNKK